MKLRISLLLLAAAFFALAAGFVSFVWLGAAQQELTETRARIAAFGELMQVPVLARAVQPGEVLKPEDFTTLRLPASYLPSDALLQLPEAPADKALKATEAVGANVLLLSHMIGIADGSEVPVISLTEGRSAAMFRAENFASLKDQLEKGTRVDIFMLSQAASGAQVRLLGSDFEVLRLPVPDTSAGPMVTTAENIMLAAPVAELAVAVLGASQGKIHLALSSGPRAATDGVVLIGQDELNSLPVAYRQGNSGFASPATGLVSDVPAAGGLGVMLPGGDDRKRCTTAVIRAGTRVAVEVPCQ